MCSRFARADADFSQRHRFAVKRPHCIARLITAWTIQSVFLACATVSPDEQTQAGRDLACQIVRDREKPIPFHRDLPTYPRKALKHSGEGIVLLSYRVLADGSTDKIFVAHSIGHAIFHEPSIRVVKDWRFAPACKDGVGVDSPRFRVMVPFRASEKAVTGARMDFKDRLIAARNALADGDFAQARSAIQKLDEMEWLTLYEVTHRSLVAGMLAYHEERYREASRLVSSALIINGKHLGKAGRLDALAWLIRVAFARGEYGEAILRLRRLKKKWSRIHPGRSPIHRGENRRNSIWRSDAPRDSHDRRALAEIP